MRKRTYTALVALALAATALACGSAPDGETPDSVETTATATKTGKAKAATFGDPVRDGKFEFVVKSIECGDEVVGPAGVQQKAQGKFCLVDLTVKNIGDRSQMFDAGSQKALDGKGNTYDADAAAALVVNGTAETFLNTINPGNQVAGMLPFDVPKTTMITEVELHDGLFSDGVKVKVD